MKDCQDLYYIVAGDEMQKLMHLQFPNRQTIPFREDFSKGEYSHCSFDEGLTTKRAAFWGIPETEYVKNLSPIIHLDTTKNYLLCFGDDACCQANLTFMIGYLKHKGYTRPIQVQILNEYTLHLQREYSV